MKKLLCILLALLMFLLPAAAEESPYALGTIEGVTIEEGEGSMTFVYGTSRVVVISIERVPDADPEAAVLRMMGQFDGNAVMEGSLSMAQGYTGLKAVTADKYSQGVDQLTVMILSDGGDLLILSGYDMAGDEEKAQALLKTLLTNLTVNGQPIVITEE